MRTIGITILALFALMVAMPFVNATCTNNFIGGNCIGDITYTSNTALVSDVNTNGNILVNSGVWLTTNSHAVIAGGTFNSMLGTINATYDVGSSCTGAYGTVGNSILTSYGGSGGGGASHTNAGNGNSASAPTMSNALIQTWNANGWQNYLEGGGGGCSGNNVGIAGGNGGNTIGNGGLGSAGGGGTIITETFGSAASYGTYIQGNAVILGNINAFGANGVDSSVNPSLGGSGGGGGVIAISYNSQYVAGTYNTLGGRAGSAVNANGGAGGNGQVVTFQWTIPPIGLPSVPITSCAYAPSNVPITSGTTFNNLLANALITCTVSTPANDVYVNFYYNNIFEGTSNTVFTFNAPWNNQNTPIVWNSLTQNGFTSSSFNFNLNSIPYSITSITANAFSYETTSQPYDININVTKAAQSANIVFTYNGAVVSNDLSNTLPTNQIFAFLAANLPLIATNGLLNTLAASGNILLSNGMTQGLGTINSMTQNELWNYVPAMSADFPNTIIGDSQINLFNLAQTQATNLAAITRNDLQIGTSNIPFQQSSPYSYIHTITSFIPNSYGLATPTGNVPTIVTENGIFDLAFNGNTQFRNASTTFNSYLENLYPCNAIYPTNAITYNFFNITNLKAWTFNVLFQGFYRIINNNYVSPTINGINAGLSPTATSNTYATCMFPPWGQFKINGTFVYNSTNTITSTFKYVNQQVTNSVPALQPQKLYLTPTFSNAAFYNIAVFNTTSQLYISALVQQLFYVVNSNSSILQTEFTTPAGGGFVTTLQNQQFYKFVVYSLDGRTLLATTPLIQAACSSPTCTYVININSANVTTLQQFTANLNYGCAVSTNTISNVSTVTCSLSTINGASITGNLSIFNNLPIFANLTCSNVRSSTSMTLTCSAPNVNVTGYTYYLKAFLTQFGWTTLTSGTFGKLGGIFNTAGLGWVLYIILVCICGFSFMVRLEIGVAGAGLGFIAAGLLGFYVLPSIALGAVIIIIAFGMYAISKGNQKTRGF